MTMNRMTPAEAWQGFVGNQTPQEFMEVSQQKGLTNLHDAVFAYMEGIPAMFWRGYSTDERAVIFRNLCAYIREQGIN